MRLIDADALNYVRVRIYHEDGTIGGYNSVVPSSEIRNAPTVEAVPATTIDDDERKKMFNEIRYWMDLCKSYEQTIVKLSVALAEQAERKEE